MKQTIIFALILTIMLITLSATVTKKDTIVFVSSDTKTIKQYIDTYSKYYYVVKSITPQNVAVSSGAYDKDIIKGDMILIMEKN